jgi:dihydrofolate reductase
MKERIIIAAIDNNNGIGKDNKLLYRLPDDLKRFKTLTTGNIVIMGRNTYDSIGKALPNRENIVITSKDIDDEVYCVRSFQDALKLAEKLDGEKVYIIGGARVYNEAIDYVQKLELTLVLTTSEADAYFPDFTRFLKMNESDLHFQNEIYYKFATYCLPITTSNSIDYENK